jgi:hypothetical protein
MVGLGAIERGRDRDSSAGGDEQRGAPACECCGFQRDGGCGGVCAVEIVGECRDSRRGYAEAGGESVGDPGTDAVAIMRSISLR